MSTEIHDALHTGRILLRSMKPRRVEQRRVEPKETS
jgi:hypothetical protein